MGTNLQPNQVYESFLILEEKEAKTLTGLNQQACLVSPKAHNRLSVINYVIRKW